MNNEHKSYKILLTVIMTLIIVMNSSAFGNTIHSNELIYSGKLKGLTMALDDNNIPNVCYSDNSFNLFYSARSEDGWNKEIVENVGESFYLAPLLLDNQGVPHIAYYVENTGLKYALRTETGWDITIVDNNMQYNFCSLALDSQGNPHICYVSNNSLKYTTMINNSWFIETIETLNENTTFLSLSLYIDSEDNLHVLYSHTDDNWMSAEAVFDIKYAIMEEDDWEIETITSTMGRITSSTLDSNNWPHILYFNGSEKIYAHKTNDGWQNEPMSMLPSIYAPLIIDSENQPNFYYFDSEDETIKIAKKVGDEWQVSTLFEYKDIPYPDSISVDIYVAIDDDTNYHFVLYDSWNEKLIYYCIDGSANNGIPAMQIVEILIVAVVATSVLALYLYSRKKMVKFPPEGIPNKEEKCED